VTRSGAGGADPAAALALLAAPFAGRSEGVVGVGIDLVTIAEVARHHHRSAYRRQLCDPDEEAACLAAPEPARALAVRFALKEACMKALGAGIGQGLHFRQIATRFDRGAAALTLRRGARARHRRLGGGPLLATVRIDATAALALVLIARAADPESGPPRGATSMEGG
jgi:holo-[acyl-carrier protein] synthase